MNDKPRLVPVDERTHPELFEAWRQDDNLGTPWGWTQNGMVYVDADELRAWRALQSTSTGGA